MISETIGDKRLVKLSQVSDFDDQRNDALKVRTLLVMPEIIENIVHL